ncbi:MAG: hypothetical protein ACRDQA_31050, partial [Nocardioidaceae bacterium]
MVRSREDAYGLVADRGIDRGTLVGLGEVVRPALPIRLAAPEDRNLAVLLVAFLTVSSSVSYSLPGATLR